MRALLVVLALALPALAAPAPAMPLFLAPVGDTAPDAGVSGGAEPTMFVAQSGTLFVGDTAGLHRTTDGGATWRLSPNPFLPGLFTDGWSVAQDDAGALYASTTQGEAIGVAVSHDDGASWSFTSQVVGAGAVADRPWLAAGPAGHVALVWYQAGAGEWCASSTDGGVTWLGRTLNNVGFSNAGNLLMDEDGSLWYATHYGVNRWQEGCAGAQQTALLPPAGSQIFVQLARTPAGDSFVAQPSWGSTGMELRGMHGLDAASLKRVVVSPPDLRSNTFGAVAARGDDEVAVAWYGSASPGDPASSAYHGDWFVHVARVHGFWSDAPTVTVTKLTASPNHRGWFCMSGVSCSGGRALADYFGIAYDDAGNLHVAYGDDVSGGGRVKYAMLPAV